MIVGLTVVHVLYFRFSARMLFDPENSTSPPDCEWNIRTQIFLKSVASITVNYSFCPTVASHHFLKGARSTFLCDDLGEGASPNRTLARKAFKMERDILSH